MKEKQNVEWKQSWRDEYLQWICAFANTEGGELYIGKDDKGRNVELQNLPKLLEDIPSKIKSKLGIISAVDYIEEDNQDFIKITTQSYTNPISYRGKYYTRSGSTTHELNGNSLTDFLLAKSGKTWDEIIVEGTTIADIDVKTIDKLIADSAGQGRLPDTEGLTHLEILQKLRLAKGEAIRRAGIVLFGKDPSEFIPNCKVMIGRFGEDSEDLKFHEFIEGNLIYTLEEVQHQLNYKFLTRPIDFVGMMRTEKDEYPIAALREILLNALVHKKYGRAAIQIRVFDDRLSIWNEGILPNGITVESLKHNHNSKPPNPNIADACFKAGYIDTWGRGTLKIFKACEDAGMPEPQIIELNGGVEVTLLKYDISEMLQRNFVDTSEIILNNIESDISLLFNEYGAFIDFIASQNNSTSEVLRRYFGDTSEMFRSKYGDNKALLLMFVVLDPKVSATVASKRLGVSSRTVETYFADLKKSILKREGYDLGGHWKIVVE